MRHHAHRRFYPEKPPEVGGIELGNRTVAGKPVQLVSGADGRPLRLSITAGQVSNYTGAAALLGDLPNGQGLLGEGGYEASWSRHALQVEGTNPAS